MGGLLHGQNAFPGIRGKAEENHHPWNASPCIPFPSRNRGFVLDLTRVDLPSPLHGHAEELGHTGGLGTRRLQNAPGRRNDAHDLVGLDPSFQGADSRKREGDDSYLDR
jgi:hypothetical protein